MLLCTHSDATHFLTDTVEGYSMSDVDDKERDGLIDKIQHLGCMMSQFTVDNDTPLPPPPDGVCNSNVLFKSIH